MSDLSDRFDKLARRGTMRGGDDVLAEARRRVDDRGDLSVVDDAAWSSPGDAGEITSLVDLEPVRARRRPRRVGGVVAAGGVAASLLVGVLAIGSFVGSGGGSDSPEGAVRRLADAVSHEDPLAAADVLAPEEVRSLKGTVDLASQRAQELALAQSASAPLTGLDLSVDNLKLSSESLGDGYVKVTVDGGVISAQTHDSQFSPLMQHALRNSHDTSAHADLSTLARSSDLPAFVVTVQRDGHWYVSAAYTALEYVREVNHLPAADFGSGMRAIATLGADSPDAAVSDAVRALAAGDWQKLISLSPPDEIPVYDYRAALVQQAGDTKPSFTVGKLDTTSTVTGDTAKVTLQASGTTDSGPWSVDGACFRFPNSYSMTVSASGSGSAGVAASQVGHTTAQSTTCGLDALSILPYTASAPTNGTAAQISVVRESGRWFVSPVGTVLDLVDHAISSLSERTLYTMLNMPDLLPTDGALTLGHPVTLAGSGIGASVYTFAGHQGEQLLGLATAKTPNPDGLVAETRIFAPDGTELDNGYGLLDGQSVTLPSDGTYKLVFQPFGDTVTVTIWDAAQAPEAAKHPRFPSGGLGSCTYSAGGATTCTSSSGGPVITPSPSTTVPSQGSSSASSTVPGG